MSITTRRPPVWRHAGVWTVVVLACAIGTLRIEVARAGQKGGGSAKELYQQAAHEEDALGNLEAAIKLYQRAVAASSDRALAARAQLRIGACYEKLGKGEASKAYETVLRDYAEQTDLVAQARARLAALGDANPGTRTSGLTARQVWAGPDVDLMGSVSSDGRYLSFVDWENGDLAIRNLATGENRRLTNNRSWDSSTGFPLFSKISPDGKQIAYDWLNRDSGWTGEMRLIGVDGVGGRVLYKNPEVPYLWTGAWSPSGEHIVAGLTRGDGTNQLALVSPADGSARVLKTADWRVPQNMAFSPDGRYILYDFPPREDTPERDIYMLAVDGSREIRLAEHPAHDTVLGWTPDGRHVLFASDRTGTNDAWIISLADGKPQGPPELVKKDLGRVFPLGFTRSGSYYYGVATGMVDVYTASLDLQTGKVLSPPARVAERFIGTNFSPDWSPDGRSLVYVSGRGRFPNDAQSRILCIASLETSQRRDLPLKLTYIGRPHWLSDGRTVLIKAQGQKQQVGLYLVDTQTGGVALIFNDKLLGQALSRDGKTVFYTRSAPDPENASRQIGQLLARNLESSAEKELFRQISAPPIGDGIVNELAVSPDGRSLAFTTLKSGESKAVMVVPTEGGPARVVYRVPKNGPAIPNFSGLAWTPDGRELLFVVGRGEQAIVGIPGERDLWAIPANGGEPRRLGLSMPGLREVRVDATGKRIAFTAGGPGNPGGPGEVWALDNLLPGLRAAR